MWRLLVLISLLVAAPQSSAPADPIERVLGAWEGTLEHDGETVAVIVEFVRKGGRTVAVFSVPRTHSWKFPVAYAAMEGTRVTAGPEVFDYDAAADTLTTTIPAEMIPKYAMKTVLRRRGAVTPDARHLEIPVKPPQWTLDVGSPAWADVAVSGDLVVVGADDGRLHGVDARSGRDRWTFATGGAIRSGAAFVDRDLLIQSDDGVLYRIDAAKGMERWHVSIAKPRTRLPLGDPASRYDNRASSPVVDGDRVYVGTHEGRLLALDARRGTRLWEFQTAESVIATPIVSGNRVYCGSFDGFLYALDAATGTLAWKADTGGAITTAAAVSGSRVIVGSRSYDLLAFDAARGTPGWTRYFWFSWVESPVTIFKSVAYVGSSDAALVSAIDPATGRVVWRTDVAGSAWGQPAVTDALVYEGVTGVLNYMSPHRGSVIALDRTTGQPRWWYPVAAPTPAPSALTPYGFAGSVAVDATHVFAGGLDGRLYAFAR